MFLQSSVLSFVKQRYFLILYTLTSPFKFFLSTPVSYLWVSPIEFTNFYKYFIYVLYFLLWLERIVWILYNRVLKFV